MINRKLSYATIVCAAFSASIGQASADDSAQAPETPPAAPTLQPIMLGPLVANPNPINYEVGPLGRVYVSGILSGLGLLQNNAFPGDDESRADISNAQVIVQKPDGLVQFYVQAGAYSLPTLGLPYIRATDTIDDFFGPLPVAFAKLAPFDNFSIQAGKLPTLIGAEMTFNFENMNIQRGLLWNQENAVNRGVQMNYTVGPVALSLAFTDGFYSGDLSWLIGSATYTFDSNNILTFVGGGNTEVDRKNTLATPVFLNNQQIYNLIYTHKSGPWTLMPYLQYTHIPKIREIGANNDAATFGGALLASYQFDSGSDLAGLSVPVRFEYIHSTGSATNGAPNLLYGPGSEALSVTVTPTYQYKTFFMRGELSYVRAFDTISGAAFGSDGNDKSQVRAVLEAGVLF